MSETRDLFALLRQSADATAAAAIERLVDEGEDRELCRINVPAFAARHGLDEQKAVAAFLHATRLGVFEISWNVLCPGCGGVIDSSATLKTVDRDEYSCLLCSAGYEPTLDEMVEVTFTVSPRVRRIAAHDPDKLSISRRPLAEQAAHLAVARASPLVDYLPQIDAAILKCADRIQALIALRA